MADQCIPVRSSWVYQFILTGGELAVQFKHSVHHYKGVAYGGVPGVTCLYPGTNANLFHIAILSPSPGRFVHQFLYKKRPYKLIRNPCPIRGQVQTTCCPNPLPATLTATIIDDSPPPPNPDCSCLAGSYPIVWNGATWTGPYNRCGWNPVNLTLHCKAGTNVWTFAFGYGLTSNSATAVADSCDPLLINFDFTLTGTGSGPGPGVCNGGARVVITA